MKVGDDTPAVAEREDASRVHGDGDEIGDQPARLDLGLHLPWDDPVDHDPCALGRLTAICSRSSEESRRTHTEGS